MGNFNLETLYGKPFYWESLYEKLLTENFKWKTFFSLETFDDAILMGNSFYGETFNGNLSWGKLLMGRSALKVFVESFAWEIFI